MEYPESLSAAEIERIGKEIAARMKREMKLQESISKQVSAALPSPKHSVAPSDVREFTIGFYGSCIYNGARHFTHVSPNASDIATVLNIPVKILLWLAALPAWEEALEYFGYMGDPTPRVGPRIRTPLPLREGYLIQEVFQKCSAVRFVTYDGIRDARVQNVGKYDFFLDDASKLSKHDVILAFGADRMYYVKKGIKRRKSVADLNLRPIIRPRDRPKIEVAARIGDTIACIMRNGLVVTGENIWISKYNIVMRVGGKKGAGGKVVLLYQHALHAFEVLQTQSEPQNASRDTFENEEDEVSETSEPR